MSDRHPMAEEVFGVATQVAELLSTSERQDLYIERWEAIWKEALPRAARECAELAASIEGLEDDLTPEQAGEMATVLMRTGEMLGKIASIEPPNPDLIALYYLRKISARLEETDGFTF